MIYLIDDKRLRQEKDFGWTSEKFANFCDTLIPIYTLEDLTDKAVEVFNENNTVLYHESFIDNSGISSQSAIKRSKLDELAQRSPSFNLVIFSGSKNTRNVNKNVAHLPVSVVYQNLAIFAEKYSGGDINLNYLSFGEKPEIESLLLEILESAIAKIEQEPVEIPEQKNLFVSTFRRKIQNPIVDTFKTTLFDEDDDNELTIFINDNLFNDKYDNLFIPLCFGKTLSDFNGLRLATHIRCTESPNQLSRIFIYGFVGFEYLFQDKYFNILKTKNVQLVGFSKQAFKEAAKVQVNSFSISELPSQIKKLKLDLPENYEDSHSIANEWAIYRWANAIEAEDDDIDKIINRVNSNLYFKYLSTLYPKNQIIKIHDSELKIKFSGSPKILYIDDEADKGWSEILCKIINDINKISYAYIGKELKNMSSENIIKSSLEKIVDDDVDLVILDFRLHVDDFNAKTIQDVTGLKLLKAIKKVNPGIQVIIFSATNKVWNLQALQEAGADGFIIKESPENSRDYAFTSNSIENMRKEIEIGLEKSFLKSFYQNFEKVKCELMPRKNYKLAINPLPKEFVNEVLKWTQLSNEILSKGLIDLNLTTSFLFYFTVIENISNRVIDIDNPIFVEDKDGRKLYNFKFRMNEQKLRNYIELTQDCGIYKKTNKPLKTPRNISWLIKILNAFDFISKFNFDEVQISNLIQKRNKIIHANATTGDKIKIEINDIKILYQYIIRGLENIK
jgi:CheY-like chemotaxis protein